MPDLNTLSRDIYEATIGNLDRYVSYKVGRQTITAGNIHRDMTEQYAQMVEDGQLEQAAVAFGWDLSTPIDPPLAERVMLVAAMNLDYHESGKEDLVYGRMQKALPRGTRERVIHIQLNGLDQLVNEMASRIHRRIGVIYPVGSREDFKHIRMKNPLTGEMEPTGVAPLTDRDLAIHDYRQMYSSEVSRMLLVRFDDSQHGTPFRREEDEQAEGEEEEEGTFDPFKPPDYSSLPPIGDVVLKAAGYATTGLLMFSAGVLISNTLSNIQVEGRAGIAKSAPQAAWVTIQLGLNWNGQGSYYVGDAVLGFGEATGYGPKVVIDSTDPSTSLVIYEPLPGTSMLPSGTRNVLHRTRQVVSLAQKALVVAIQPSVTERFKAVAGIGIDLANFFYGTIPQYNSGDMLTKSEFGYLVYYDVMGFYDSSRDVTDLYQNRGFIKVIAQKLPFIPSRVEQPQVGPSFDEQRFEEFVDAESSKYVKKAISGLSLEEDAIRMLENGYGAKDDSPFTQADVDALVAEMKPFRDLLDEAVAMNKRKFLNPNHEEALEEQVIQREKVQREMADHGLDNPEESKSYQEAHARAAEKGVDPDLQHEVAMGAASMEDVLRAQIKKFVFKPAPNLEWDLGNIYADPIPEPQVTYRTTPRITTPPVIDFADAERKPPEEDKEGEEEVTVKRDEPKTADVATPTPLFPLANAFIRDTINTSKMYQDRYNSLRPFLPHAGTELFDEQGSDEAVALKIDNLLMGQVKPLNWPLGGIDSNPLHMQNIANQGLQQMGPLNETPTYYEGGTLTMGDRLYGTVRGSLLSAGDPGPPLKIRKLRKDGGLYFPKTDASFV